MFSILLAILCGLLLINVAHGSVVLNNTRIIIDNDRMEKTVQFTNSGDKPALIQIKSVGNKQSERPPFVALPQVFRILPKAGQAVKVNIIKSDLPKDRETLFYMDYMEIPSVKKGDENKNKLYLIVNSRVKIIVRPSSLAFSFAQLRENLSYRWFGNNITIKNNSPFYANIRSFYLTDVTGKVVYPNGVTVPPFGESNVSMKRVGKATAGMLMTALIINDFGADEKIDINEK